MIEQTEQNKREREKERENPEIERENPEIEKITNREKKKWEQLVS